MRLLIFLFAVISVCWARPRNYNEGLHAMPVNRVDTYILDGIDAFPGEFPWQLSLQQNGVHFCGGSLLSGIYALTAGHCVEGLNPDSLTVVAGLYYLSDLSGTQRVGVESFVVHPAYNFGSALQANDIAVVTFKSSVVYGGNVEPGILPADDGTNFAGTPCVISGWGPTDALGNPSNTLQKATVSVLTTEDCEAATGGLIGVEIWDDHICGLDYAGTKAACGSDAGGPLSCPYSGNVVVAGIGSWVATTGDQCLATYPSVYTRVSSYLEWIILNTP